MIILQLSSWTAYSLTTSQDSLCFSKPQAAKIMKDLSRINVLDSISQMQHLQIINYKTIVIALNDKSNIMYKKLEDSNKQLKTSNLKLKISTKINKFGIPSIFIGGIIGGFILAK